MIQTENIFGKILHYQLKILVVFFLVTDLLGGDKLVPFLVVADGQLEVTGDDPDISIGVSSTNMSGVISLREL